jgi:RimJ/RimL family protein N-acetyltransferase
MPSPTAAIATDRLDLVPLRVADADEMSRVHAEPALYAFIGGAPPTRDELAERYAIQVRGVSADGRETWHNWIVRERASGVAVGFVQATVTEPAGVAPRPAGETPRSAEIAWLIGVAWQGRGYATEAARGLAAWLEAGGVGSIVAHVHPDHAASAAVARRAGHGPTDRYVDGERAWERLGPPRS